VEGAETEKVEARALGCEEDRESILTVKVVSVFGLVDGVLLFEIWFLYGRSRMLTS